MRSKVFILSIVFTTLCWKSAQAAPSCFEVFRIDPTVSADRIKNLGRLGNMRGRSLLTGEIDGVKVVIKPEPAPKDEAYYTALLDQLGLGPKFFGLVSFKRAKALQQQLHPSEWDNFGLVVEYIADAVFVKPGERIYTRRTWTKSEIDAIAVQVEKAALLLGSRGVVMEDFQFMLTKDNRIYIIDPQLYERIPDAAQATKLNLLHVLDTRDALKPFVN